MDPRIQTLIPLKGTDQLVFGTPRKEIREKFAEQFNGEFNRDDDQYDDYKLFHALFRDDKLYGVEFFYPTILQFENQQLVGMNYIECKKLFFSLDPEIVIEKYFGEVGFTSLKLQIGCYAPSGFVESIMVASEGYYKY